MSLPVPLNHRTSAAKEEAAMTNEQTVVTLDEIGIEEMDQVIAPGVVLGD